MIESACRGNPWLFARDLGEQNTVEFEHFTGCSRAKIINADGNMIASAIVNGEDCDA